MISWLSWVVGVTGVRGGCEMLEEWVDCIGVRKNKKGSVGKETKNLDLKKQKRLHIGI